MTFGNRCMSATTCRRAPRPAQLDRARGDQVWGRGSFGATVWGVGGPDLGVLQIVILSPNWWVIWPCAFQGFHVQACRLEPTILLLISSDPLLAASVADLDKLCPSNILFFFSVTVRMKGRVGPVLTGVLIAVSIPRSCSAHSHPFILSAEKAPGTMVWSPARVLTG